MDHFFSLPPAAPPPPAPTQPPPSDSPSNEQTFHATLDAPVSESTPQSTVESTAFPSNSDGDSASIRDDAMLHVRLKLLDERVFDVHVECSLSVVDFRVTVHQATAIPTHLQRLIYRGKLLKDGTLLSTYGIQDGHIIHLVSKPQSANASPAVASTPTPTSSSPPTLPASTPTRGEFTQTGGESNAWQPLHDRLNRTLRTPEEPLQSRESSGLLSGRRGRAGLTGDAWNLAVLREALGQQSDRVPAVPSNRMPEPPPDVAADLGLAPNSSTSTPAVQPNLDHITQGILTLRTVLSTAVPLSQQRERVEQAEAEPVAEADGMASEQTNTMDQGGDDSSMEQAQALETAVDSTNEAPRRGRRRYYVGQWLDVKDTVNQWLECTVMNISEDKVLVHYHGWPLRWDEWIDFESDRIAAFRTRTQQTQAPHLSPTPTTRLPNAPPVGDNDMRRIIPQLRDLMRDALPFIDQLAELCEDPREESTEDEATSRQADLSELAHVVSPFFDRFGRLLVDSSVQMDPFLRPEHRVEERRRRHVRARGAERSSSSTPSIVVEESSESLRDLITPALPRASNDTQNAGRRSIDVHIHAIVAPSSLSSLASLARLGTAIAGAMESGSRSNSPALRSQRSSSSGDALADAFGLPRLRPLQGGSGDRSILSDIAEPEDEDSRTTDTRRTPLLSSYRSGTRGETTVPRPRPSNSRLSTSRWMDTEPDDFFGPSFSQDSDDMDDPLLTDGFGAHDRSNEDQVQYREISSRRESEESSGSIVDQSDRLGVIPEIQEAERREQEQQDSAQAAERDSSSSVSSAFSSSSSSMSSSPGSTGFPTLLEVMRRTLSGVRGFGFSSSSSSSASSASSDNSRAPSSDSTAGNVVDSTFLPRPREASSGSLSSIGEDLDSVD